LTNKEINIDRDLKLSRIEAARIAEQRDAELQKGVEIKRREMELERQRATTVTKAVIQRESEMERANAELYTRTKHAEAVKLQQLTETDADVYKQNQNAEAKFFAIQQDALGVAERRTKEAAASKKANEFSAEAHLYTAQKEAEGALERVKREAEGTRLIADADFYAQKQKAAGMLEMARAYGAMADVLGGPSGLLQYMMLERGTYEHMATANAKAINGLQPKINVWTTGSGAEADASAPIRNLFQALPPLLSTIQDQTGMMPPAWLAQMPQKEDAQALSKLNGGAKGAAAK
jgi:flotillin